VEVDQAADARKALARVFREEAGILTGALVRILGDFGVAEELVQDALVVALQRWPIDGVPRKPGAWLMTTARHLALNRLYRGARLAEKLASWTEDAGDVEADDRLRLLFVCCHPALGRDAQVALTLRAVCGLTTGEIAHAFLSKESAVAQRIVRARRKIVEARIPYRMPADDELAPRLHEALTVLYLMFNEGYLASGGPSMRRDLSEDATWLASLVGDLLPNEPEVEGLLALMKFHLSRADARFDGGELVLLQHQDRSRWRRALIDEAGGLLAKAAAAKRVGPFQVEAAIAAVHSEAPRFESTDWRQIVALYDLLLTLADSPVVGLNRAIALRWVAGPEAALKEVDALASALDGYHLFHATRGGLLVEIGQRELARAAHARALSLTKNEAERSLIQRRLFPREV
jgi:RNA polymerase sigma-70 factor (ECF subfamily)